MSPVFAKALRIGLILMLTFAIAALSCPLSPECPIHEGLHGYFVGTQMIDGVLMGKYKCPRGHTFLVRCE
jgi:hypothetical protein